MGDNDNDAVSRGNESVLEASCHGDIFQFRADGKSVMGIRIKHGYVAYMEGEEILAPNSSERYITIDGVKYTKVQVKTDLFRNMARGKVAKIMNELDKERALRPPMEIINTALNYLGSDVNIFEFSSDLDFVYKCRYKEGEGVQAKSVLIGAVAIVFLVGAGIAKKFPELRNLILSLGTELNVPECSKLLKHISAMCTSVPETHL